MSGADIATVAEMFSGRYEVVEPIAWNGLALMFRAKRAGKSVVLALLPIDADRSPAAGALFEARATALVGLEHPRLVPVLGHGIQHGVPFLELGFVQGPTLDHLLVLGPLPRDRALVIARRILKALELLEAVGMPHLDLTPTNIVVGPDDDVRVVGTGIAGVLNAVRDDDKTGPTGKGSGPSPGRFLAPELLIGDPVDRRADLFSVGALLYLMLTGHPPGRDGPHPPKDLAPLLERSMAKLPESRYPRAAAMRNAIDALGLTASVTPPPVLQLVDGSTPPPLGLEGEEVPANILAPVVDESPEPGRRGARVIVGVIVAVVFLSAAAIGAVLVMRGGGQSPPASVATPGPVPEPPEPPAPEPDLEPTLDPEPDAPVDLLAGELPAEMAELAPRVAAGEELSVQELRPLQRWAGDNRDDARPHLLIARAFLNKGWNSNAVERYLQAYQADPESRADARMLTDLVQLSTHNESGPAAATAIARIYGREALPAIEAKLAQDIGWPGDQRLERLRTRIERADD